MSQSYLIECEINYKKNLYGIPLDIKLHNDTITSIKLNKHLAAKKNKILTNTAHTTAVNIRDWFANKKKKRGTSHEDEVESMIESIARNTYSSFECPRIKINKSVVNQLENSIIEGMDLYYNSDIPGYKINLDEKDCIRVEEIKKKKQPQVSKKIPPEMMKKISEAKTSTEMKEYINIALDSLKKKQPKPKQQPIVAKKKGNTRSASQKPPDKPKKKQPKPKQQPNVAKKKGNTRPASQKPSDKQKSQPTEQKLLGKKRKVETKRIKTGLPKRKYGEWVNNPNDLLFENGIIKNKDNLNEILDMYQKHYNTGYYDEEFKKKAIYPSIGILFSSNQKISTEKYLNNYLPHYYGKNELVEKLSLDEPVILKRIKPYKTKEEKERDKRYRTSRKKIIESIKDYNELENPLKDVSLIDKINNDINTLISTKAIIDNNDFNKIKEIITDHIFRHMQADIEKLLMVDNKLFDRIFNYVKKSIKSDPKKIIDVAPYMTIKKPSKFVPIKKDPQSPKKRKTIDEILKIQKENLSKMRLKREQKEKEKEEVVKLEQKKIIQQQKNK